MKKICFVTTTYITFNAFIKENAEYLHDSGVFDISLICDGDSVGDAVLPSFIHFYPVKMKRGVSLTALSAIRRIKNIFRKNHFDLVQYSTPNASFYASIASKCAKVPIRLYCQWGMVYVTMSGIKRRIFRFIEKLTCKNSTVIQPDSVGNREFCIREKLYDENKSEVIWNGSAKGVDLNVFDITKKAEYSKEIKQKFSIGQKDIVIGFVGRLGREKGCHELFAAFKKLNEENNRCKLLFVGPIEKTETIDPIWLKYFYDCKDIIKTDRVTDVQKYISAMDVFVLPTYREGFGMSVVEASAMGVPVVTTKYPGPSGAMIDGETGIAVDIKDEHAVYVAIKKILEDKDFATELGKKGEEFVKSNFDQVVFKEKLLENRKKLLGI